MLILRRHAAISIDCRHIFRHTFAAFDAIRRRRRHDDSSSLLIFRHILLFFRRCRFAADDFAAAAPVAVIALSLYGRYYATAMLLCRRADIT